MHFVDRLFAAVRRVQNPVVVGIDPRPEELPPGFLDRFPETCEGVADALRHVRHRSHRRRRHPGRRGEVPVRLLRSLWSRRGRRPARDRRSTPAKGLIVIVDGKRNDIGSTAEAYARAYLGKVPVGGRYEPSWSADALTVNPYLGTDGVMPFVRSRRPGEQGVSSSWSARATPRPANSRTSWRTADPSTATSPIGSQWAESPWAIGIGL